MQGTDTRGLRRSSLRTPSLPQLRSDRRQLRYRGCAAAADTAVGPLITVLQHPSGAQLVQQQRNKTQDLSPKPAALL